MTTPELAAEHLGAEYFADPRPATAMVSYFRALLAAKRREPTDDLLSALIAARDQADSLSEDELVSMAFLLLVAGHETTVNLIASGVLALLLNPAELARLAAGPGLIRRRGGGTAAVRGAGQPHDVPVRRRASRPRRRAHWPGRPGVHRAERREPGPGPVRRPGRARPGPGQLRAPGVRARHPLLRRRAAGPARGGDRLRRPAEPVRPAWSWPCRRSRCAGGRARSSTAWSPSRCGWIPPGAAPAASEAGGIPVRWDA